MRIQFERSGGFAGIPVTRTIDCEALPAEEERKLRELVESARFFELPAVMLATEPGADRFHYKITVKMDDRIHSIRLDEASLPSALKPLLNWLMAAARKP